MKRCLTALPFIFCVSGAYALTPTQWQYRQSIVVPSSGLVQVQLPIETLDVARADLSDLRIVDATEKEVPFLVDQPMPQPESSVSPKDFRAEMVSSETRLLITTGTDFTLTGVEVAAAASGTFTKAMRVEARAIKKIGGC
jgi:hypothetical protein